MMMMMIIIIIIIIIIIKIIEFATVHEVCQMICNTHILLKVLTPRFQVLSNVKRHTKEYRQAPRHHRNTCCFVVCSNTCARYS